MDINEMTLEQLQDYALELKNTVASKDEELKAKDTNISELQDLNKTLQQRNNELFRRVEQQVPGATPGADNGPQDNQQTCEELAKNKFKEFIR